jgi:hypothetical protein
MSKQSCNHYSQMFRVKGWQIYTNDEWCLNLNGIFLTSKLKHREFRTSVFCIGGAVTFTLGPCCSLLGRIPDKTTAAPSQKVVGGEVMIFFEKNKVLGVEPNRVLNILEGI